MTTSAIRRLIRSAGREPIERDTLYNVVTGAMRRTIRSHGSAEVRAR